MPKIIDITDLSLPALFPYSCRSEIPLLRYYEPEPGLFIAESPNVIHRALDAGYEPLSMLVEKDAVYRGAAKVIERCGEIPVYTAKLSLIGQLTGYKLTMGALCVMRRKPSADINTVCKGASRVAVLEDITNPTNVGAIFRSAAALGFDAVLLTADCSDPLYRRCARVSMGTVFQIPWAYFDKQSSADDCAYVKQLKDMGFSAAAMALTENSVPVDDPRLLKEEKLAVILGNESSGLRRAAIGACDYVVKIPMSHGVDSLNVAAASAVAFWQLGKR